MPGADRNAYLTFAAAIAAGLDGIERKLELPDDAPRLLVDATTNLGGAQITTSEYTVVATG